jgi:hypothetical protein
MAENRFASGDKSAPEAAADAPVLSAAVGAASPFNVDSATDALMEIDPPISLPSRLLFRLRGRHGAGELFSPREAETSETSAGIAQ